MFKKTGLVIVSWLTFSSPLVVYADSFLEPTSVPSGTVIKIDGSSSLTTVNQALAQAFLQKYPKTNIKIQYQGSDAALQALQRSEIDLAAIGRPLTVLEQAQGFKSVALPRQKIAIVVSVDNPFQGHLTDQQVAAIFQGKISDWSELGGEKASIRVIDRPSSDTRQSFASYPVFATGEVIAGSNTVPVTEDSTAAMTRELGKYGISYTIADQAENNPNLRILKLFNTSVSDPRYPFSQPRYLVYKDSSRPGVAYFLGFVKSEIGQNAIAEASPPQEKALAAGEAIPTVTPSIIADGGGSRETEAPGLPLGLWGLLPLGLLAGLLLWWRNRRPRRELPLLTPPESLIAFETPEDIISFADSESETILDLPENIADTDLDTEAMPALGTIPKDTLSTGQDRVQDTIPDYPFPSQPPKEKNITLSGQDTALDIPFPDKVKVNPETIPDHPFANTRINDETVLDIPEEEEDTGLPSGMPSGVIPLINVSTVETSRESSDRILLTANSQAHCYELDGRQLLNLESRSNCYLLEQGIYSIKIAKGYFSYGDPQGLTQEEPMVLIWVFGGCFINRKTKVTVGQTWSSLNGYKDSLDLQVLEPTRLCGLFFDTHPQDNRGQIVLSIIKH
jgi:ABC-type phosphate transport system substrate-binding protein